MIPILIAAGMLVGSAFAIRKDPRMHVGMVKISAALLALMITIEVIYG